MERTEGYEKNEDGSRVIKCGEVLESVKGWDGLLEILSKCRWHEEEIELREMIAGRALEVTFQPSSRFPFFKAGVDYRGPSRERRVRRLPKKGCC
jgi:hypothetical protein